MSKILTLSAIGRGVEAARYQKSLNKLLECGEVWELNDLLTVINREIERYRD